MARLALLMLVLVALLASHAAACATPCQPTRRCGVGYPSDAHNALRGEHELEKCCRAQEGEHCKVCWWSGGCGWICPPQGKCEHVQWEVSDQHHHSQDKENAR
eukprot:TRINITY_DN10653_c0_g1_i1.p4 TRINITY_DN10653_c0_g1~~TRINITY_DN10653_c0_g1_i1.p4  ORF type:complete len:103 (+),score=25.55 TRINITY_DN10653_c0_g1_i1:97-405(+)